MASRSKASNNYVVGVSRPAYLCLYEGVNSLLDYLGDCGYEVDILMPSEEEFLDLEDQLKTARVRTVVPEFRAFGMRLRCPVTCRLLIDGVIRLGKRRPRFVLTFDPLGGVVGALLARLFRVPLVTYALELPPSRRQKMNIWDRIHHWCIRCADLYVTYDDYHADFVARQTRIPPQKIVNLPNAAAGGALPVRDQSLREELQLSEQQVMVLHSGSFGPWFMCLELAQAARDWPDHFRLVFHTNCRVDSESYLAVFRALGGIDNVLLHNNPVPSQELDRLVSSADVGLALYSVEKLGYRAELMGFASGKIGRYLKNGVPVIATDLPTVRPYLNDYRCGICVGDPCEVRHAVERIMADYDTYSNNAIRCYQEAWQPTRFLQAIGERIRQLPH